MSAKKVVHAEEVLWLCTNCGFDWSTRAVARSCCSTCERILPHPSDPNLAVACGKKRVWSAPLRGPGSHLFPLGFCEEHGPPAEVRALWADEAAA